MKTFYQKILAAVMLTAAVACSKSNSSDISADSFFEKEGLTTDFDNLQFGMPVAYLGGLKQDRDEPWIRARARGEIVSDPEQANIIILGNSLLSENADKINSAYQDDKFIIVGDANLTLLSSLRKKYGWYFVIPSTPPMADYAFGFCKRHSIMLEAPLWVKTETRESGDDIREIKGSDIYQNTSPFYSARPLIHFMIKARNTLLKTKASEPASKLNESNNTLVYSVPRSEYWEAIFRRHLRVYNSFSVDYAIFPCYLPEGCQNHGDYYAVAVTATNYAPTMYEYEEDPEKAVGSKAYAHYWTREYSYWGDAQFIGPYNTQMKFKSYDDSGLLSFSTAGVPSSDSDNGHPSPGTDIDTKSFSDSKSISWEAGISGGGGKQGTKKGGSGGGSLSVGAEKSSSVEYSTSDLRVINNSDHHTVKYEFNYQNLPSNDSDFDNYVGQMPAICHSTANFDMAWTWTTSAKGDYDESIIPIKTDVSQNINIWSRDKDAGVWKNYMATYTRSHNEVNDTLMKLERIPVGCLRVENKCSGTQILYNTYIVDETGATVFTAVNSIARDEYIEVALPQKGHSYSVYFNMGKSRASTVPYYSYESSISLPLMLDKDTKKILIATEDGGDFATDAGLIRIKNQSCKNLVRDLAVCKTDGTVVMEYPNSIGIGESADLHVNADTEYYITMNFGSSDDFQAYKSAKNITPSPYHSETDIKVLIATDNGGDFVKE